MIIVVNIKLIQRKKERMTSMTIEKAVNFCFPSRSQRMLKKIGESSIILIGRKHTGKGMSANGSDRRTVGRQGQELWEG